MGCSLGISHDAQKEADDEEGVFSKSQTRNDSDSSPSKKKDRSPLKKIFKKGGTLEREKAKKDAEAKKENGDAKETIANGGSAEPDLATKLTPPVVVITDLEPLEAEVKVENGEAEKTDEVQAEERKDGPATDAATAVQVESNQNTETGNVEDEPSKDQEKPIDDFPTGEVKDLSEPVANAIQDAENSTKEASVTDEAPTTEAAGQRDGEIQTESKDDEAPVPNKEEPEINEKESTTPPHKSSDAKTIPEFSESIVTDVLVQAESMVRSEESTTSSLSTLSSSTITPVEGSTDGASPVSDEQSEPSKSEVAEEEDSPSSPAVEDTPVEADRPSEATEEKPSHEETAEEKTVEEAVASEVEGQPEAAQEDKAAEDNLADEKSENAETQGEDSMKELKGDIQVQTEVVDDVAAFPEQVEVNAPAEGTVEEEAPVSSEHVADSAPTEETKIPHAEAMKAANSTEQLDDYINEIAEEAQRQLEDGAESPDVKEVMETQQRQEETELAEALIEVEKAAAVDQAVAVDEPAANQADAGEEAGDRAENEVEASEGEVGTQDHTDSEVAEDVVVAKVAKSSKTLPEGIFDDKDEEVIPDTLGEDYEMVDDKVEENVEEQKEDEPETMGSEQVQEEEIIPEAAPKKVLSPDEETSKSDAKGDNNVDADPEAEGSEEKEEVGQGESIQSFAATLVNEAITQAETTALERMNEENSEAAGEEIHDEVASDQKPETAEESGVSETEKVEEGADEASAASGDNIPAEMMSEAAIAEQVTDDSEGKEIISDEQTSDPASQDKKEDTTDVESPVSPVESSPGEKSETSEISENVEDVTDEVSQEASKDSSGSTSATDEKPSSDVNTGAAEETATGSDEDQSAKDVTDETSYSAESDNIEGAAKSKTESSDEPENPPVEDISTPASSEVSTPSK